MNRIHKITAMILAVMPILAAGCGQQEAKEYDKTIICSDFVSYDITRRITEGVEISVEGIDFSSIDWERGISGRDKNRINHSMLFVNGTWIDEEKLGEFEGMQKISLSDFGERKKNDKDNNKLYSGINITKEDEKTDNMKTDANRQVVVNPGANTSKSDNNKDKNTGKNHIGKDNIKDNKENNAALDNSEASKDDSEINNSEENNSEASSEAADNSETQNQDNANKEGIHIYFADSSYSAPPVGTDKNGKSLGNFEAGYEINGSEANPDEYWLWLCDRISSMGVLCKYTILDNGNGTYTIFEDNTALTPRYKVVASIEDIPISSFWKTRDVIAESSTKTYLSGYEDCFMKGEYGGSAKAEKDKKITLAATVDYAEGFWLDMKNTRTLAKEVKDKLVEIDPDNADVYTSNYEKLDDELAALDDKYQFTVDSSKNHLIFIGGPFVYGYMAEAYGIDYVSIYDYAAQEEQATPTRLINFAAIIDEYDIKYIVKDKDSSMEGIDSVRAEADHNINTLIIDTVEHVDDWENTSYTKIMEDNCTILKKSLY